MDPLSLKARGCLLPQFLCVGNGLEGAEDTIRRGNERVLKARLADAAFFLDADRAVASEQRRAQLSRSPSPKGSAACWTAVSGWSGWRKSLASALLLKRQRKRMPLEPPTSASTIWLARWWVSSLSFRA